MISEVVRPKNVLTLAQGIFSKNDRKKSEYEIVIHISLIKDGVIDDQYDRKTSIEEFDLNFFNDLIKLNNEKLDEFEKSRNYLGRVWEW